MARLTRRGFLGAMAAAPLAASAPRNNMRGIFVIVATPFTRDKAMAYADLAKEVDWLNRCGAHGLVWPQRASEFDRLKPSERKRGYEVIAKAAKGKPAAVVFGVQAPDLDGALDYLNHAERQSPDALIAIPPAKAKTLDDYRSYYSALAEATSRPIFIQTTGGASHLTFPVSLLIELAKKHSNLAYVKEEIDPVFERMRQLGSQRPPMKRVFSGAAGKGMLLEMAMNMDGTMPGASYTDVYVKIWDAWQAGDHEKARAIFDKLLPLLNLHTLMGQGYQYILWRRGVFQTPVSRRPRNPITDEMKTELDAALAKLKPYLKV